MREFALVAMGGAIGACLRHMVSVAAVRLFGAAFPWGTLGVNIVGSLVMGVVVELLARRVGSSHELRLFLATGILGGFTTFSAFSLDVAMLWERGDAGYALAYVMASVALSVGALFAGLWLVRAIA